MRKPESVYNESIRTALVKAGAKVIKTHGSPYTVKGTPDLIGVYKGFAFAIETKLMGETLTAKQMYELDQWRKAGAVALVASKGVHTPEDIIEKLETGIGYIMQRNIIG